MSSVQRFFSGCNNLAREATLLASSVRASATMERVRVQRAGNGRVLLSGSYSGHEALDLEVQLLAGAAGAPRASAPQFVGVGNGLLQVLGVDAQAPLQEVVLTLEDLGVATAAAGLDVGALRIAARTPGAAGNQIRITVAPQLQYQATAWALLADWAPGQALQQGAQWDFGALALSAAGELDAASPRIAFGDDPQVYRPWRALKDGAWQFGLSPQLVRAVPAGTPVWAVSGGYVVSVTDGARTEVLGDVLASPAQAPIVSFYDFLSALAASDLVQVAGVVAADRLPGGQAAMDVPLVTRAWLLSQAGKLRLHDLQVPPNAPTQSVLLRCANADVLGSERWLVRGDVSGALGQAVTGERFESDAIAFTVPPLAPMAPQDANGRWSFKFNPAARQDSEGLPSVCVRPLRLGRNAQARSVTFRYAKRPPADCKCSDVPTPLIPSIYLGLEETMANDPVLMARLSAMYAWREQFVRANTAVVAPQWLPAQPAVPSDPGTPDIEFWSFGCLFRTEEKEAQLKTGRFATRDAAEAAHEQLDQLWSEQVLPAGTQVGDVLVLAGVTMTVQSMYLGGYSTLPIALAPHMLYGVQKGVFPGRPASGGAPERPAQQQSAQFKAAARDLDWLASVWPIFTSALRQVYAHPGALAAWDALWAQAQADLAHLAGPDNELADRGGNPRFLERYRASADNVLLLAGILPKSDPSSQGAGGCWVDPGDDFWWVDTEGYFLPAFTNQGYVSCRRHTESGEPYSTMEFGFGLVVACPDRLKVGDEVTLKIEAVDALRPYGVGDEVLIKTVGAGPAWLSGGVDGSDVQTWRVRGSLSGALPSYLVPTSGAPVPPYSAHGLELAIAPGGIGFALGDRFSLSLEAGQWRWRAGAGAFSAPQDIAPDGLALLPDGLALRFEPGAAPSFVPGDVYGFAVHQPHAVSQLLHAGAGSWAWAGDAAQVLLDLGAPQALSALALARCSLPPGARAWLECSLDASSWSAPLALDVQQQRLVVQFLPAPLQARWVRLRWENAAGGSVGWLWLGVPLALSQHASSVQRRRHWAAQRADGVNAPALYAGCGDGWALRWEQVLHQDDAQALVQLVDWAQQRDEPLVVLPHFLHPQDAALVRCQAQSLEVSDVHEYQPNDAGRRLLSAQLDFEPVFA